MTVTACILAIDTSTPEGQVAVWQQGAVVLARSFQSERSHNAQLFGPLGEALERCGDRLDLVVVGTGPGSYTGVRIGIAAAQGLGWSRQVPVVGLPSLLALEEAADLQDYVVCGDARRGQYFAAEVRSGVVVEQPIPLMKLENLVRRRIERPEESWFTLDPQVPSGLEGVLPCQPSAARLAVLGARWTPDERAERQTAMLEPVYLSAPFITQAKKKNPLEQAAKA